MDTGQVGDSVQVLLQSAISTLSPDDTIPASLYALDIVASHVAAMLLRNNNSRKLMTSPSIHVCIPAPIHCPSPTTSETEVTGHRPCDSAIDRSTSLSLLLTSDVSG